MSDLAALTDVAGDAGIFCDFDGCLAPIIADPDAVRAVRGTSAVLRRLARRFRVVAVVSGRSGADLARRLRVPGVRLIGLHGMEEVVGTTVVTAPGAEAARAAVERAARRLAEELRGVRGAVLEPKGLALAVHFRRAADPEEAERLAAPIVATVAADEGLALVPGRRIIEVRPAHGGDKGDAVKRVIEREGLRGALVAGDDVGDLPAFAAVAELEVPVRVAVASEESPPALVDAADLVVSSPQELVAMLRKLTA